MTATGPWWSHWSVDLPAVFMVGGLTALYLRGAATRARRGVARPRRTAAFLGGALLVLLGQVSPVAAWSEVLLWPHMIQHLMITVVAAPLLALGAPVTNIRVALPPGPRHQLALLVRRSRRWRRTVGVPPLVLAVATHVLLLWLWHTPLLYDAAVTEPGLHLLEHASFLASAVWFWSEVWATARRSRRVQALATLCLGAMIVQGGVLGALLTFAGRSLFAVYDGAGGLTALEDQQLAGALMWVPPGFVYASVAVRRFIGWLRVAESDLRRRDLRERDQRAAAVTADAALSEPTTR
jgi:putative membrane protein